METDGECLIQGGPYRMILVALTLISAFLPSRSSAPIYTSDQAEPVKLGTRAELPEMKYS